MGTILKVIDAYEWSEVQVVIDYLDISVAAIHDDFLTIYDDVYIYCRILLCRDRKRHTGEDAAGDQSTEYRN